MMDMNEAMPMVLTGNGDGTLSLGDEEIWRALDKHGAILFHRFGLDEEQLYGLASRFNKAFLMSPFGDRRTVSDKNELQTVTLGRRALDLHFEFGNSPFRPDLLWFYCRTPPAQGEGGETLVADGAAIFNALSAETKRVLARKRIKYVNYIPADSFDAAFAGDKAIQKVIGGDVMEWLRDSSDTRIVRSSDSRVIVEYLASPVRTGGDGTLQLCQNIFTAAYKRPFDDGAEDSFSSLVTWENGVEIDAEIIDEIRRLARSMTKGIRWQERDFVLIDNNRVLHGRRSTTDLRRDVLLLSSFSTRYRAASAVAQTA